MTSLFFVDFPQVKAGVFIRFRLPSAGVFFLADAAAHWLHVSVHMANWHPTRCFIYTEFIWTWDSGHLTKINNINNIVFCPIYCLYQTLKKKLLLQSKLSQDSYTDIDLLIYILIYLFKSLSLLLNAKIWENKLGKEYFMVLLSNMKHTPPHMALTFDLNTNTHAYYTHKGCQTFL